MKWPFSQEARKPVLSRLEVIFLINWNFPGIWPDPNWTEWSYFHKQIAQMYFGQNCIRTKNVACHGLEGWVYMFPTPQIDIDPAYTPNRISVSYFQCTEQVGFWASPPVRVVTLVNYGAGSHINEQRSGKLKADRPCPRKYPHESHNYRHID